MRSFTFGHSASGASSTNGNSVPCLSGLAHGPRPAIAGLDDELRTLDRRKYRDRDAAYKRSQLSLTEFGKAIVAHREDFSRHNPIRSLVGWH